jgi:hypothetical protein
MLGRSTVKLGTNGNEHVRRDDLSFLLPKQKPGTDKEWKGEGRTD